jgi:hypothetical protein
MSNALTISCLIPFLAARSAISGLATRLRPDPEPLASSTIARRSADEIDLDELFAAGQPTIIEGLVETLRPRLTGDLETLRQATQRPRDVFEVRVFDKAEPYFLYTGNYGQRHCDTREMTLEVFLESMFDTEAFREHAVYRLFDRRALEGFAGDLIDALAEALEPRLSREPEKRASGIWIGSRGVVTPLHYDAWPGLLFQTHGAKRVLMFAPEDIPRLYFLPQYAVGDRWSRLPGRSGEADPDQFPRYSRARRYEGTLSSGEVLFIPPFWPHEIEALESNISMPFRFNSSTADYFHPRFLRPACEVFHGRILKRLWR